MESASQPVPKKSTALAKTIGHRNFDPKQYAKSISAQSDGDKDLQEHKQRVQTLGEETAHILKKQVYKYYEQFIETAKEISYVEGEMFQLNHILTEQKNLMDSMANIFLIKEQPQYGANEKKSKENIKKDEQRKVMRSLVEKVQGCPDITDVSTRFLIHDGDLSELDMDNFSPIRKVHLFLFNDALMVTTWAGLRRGQPVPGKYKFECLFDLENLAVINARDAGPVKCAFKILIFPDSNMFQCESSKEKREWLDILEETKKKFLADREHNSPVSPTTPMSPNLDPFNPFSESPGKSSGSKKMEGNASLDNDKLNEVWIQEMPEDLDVYIAQRYFKEAVELVLKTKAFLDGIGESATKKEVDAKLSARTSQLVSVLTKELQTAPDRSHRGGPRAARNPVLLLIKLGESTKACQLFLHNRSSAVSYALKQLRTEGYLQLYIAKMCKVFFNNLKETLKEFETAFKDHPGCYSTFVVWSQTEIKVFVGKISQQVFTRKADIAEIGDCTKTVFSQSKAVHIIGLDLDFAVTSLLVQDIESTIIDHKQKLIDAIKLRSSEELWKPTNAKTPQALLKIQEEMTGYGILNIGQYCFDDCFCYLTLSTLAFTRAIVIHVDSVIKMYLPEIQKLLLDSVEEIERCYTDFVAGCLRCEQERPEKARLIKRNAMFVAESLLPLIENKIQKCVLQIPKQLTDLRRDFIKQTSS
ncbi:exocyst complex component 8-like [Styela clava]